MNQQSDPALFFVELNEQTAFEIEQKGWFEHARVRFPDGREISVCFWDPIRLAQDLDFAVKRGATCFAEHGLIVVPKVTIQSMHNAVRELGRRGYFSPAN